MGTEKTETSVCPLCGGPNGCAIVAGMPAASCWCMGAVIREETLARVPGQFKGKACICAACAAGRSEGRDIGVRSGSVGGVESGDSCGSGGH